MVDDSPAKKTRRPRAELKELMIQGGVEVLQEHGVETQLSSISYAKVFEHLERTQGIRITYGSVHERIWNSLQEYQLSIIERAGVWDHADVGHGDAWVDWLQTMVALSSSSTDQTVADAARDGARATYAARTAAARAVDDEVAAMLTVALADGLQLRAHLTGDDGGELRHRAEALLAERLGGDGPA